MDLLHRKSQTSQGRMEAIQVGHQLSSQQVTQLQKLRQLISAQMQMHAGYMATDTERKAIEDAHTQRYYQGSGVILGNEARF